MNIGHFSTTRKLDDVVKEAMMGINLSDHVFHSFGDVVHLFVLDKPTIRGAMCIGSNPSRQEHSPKQFLLLFYL